MKISGFTFIHNALVAGYPVFEAMAMVAPLVHEMIVIDMQSDDGTRELLDKVAEQYGNGNLIKIVDGEWWPGKAGRCLSYNHSLYKQHCTGDVVWHFEADEVYDKELTYTIADSLVNGVTSISVHRLQVEQNFQRVRWYPEAVHRVWPRDWDVAKSGHTTTKHNTSFLLKPEDGFLWDVTNCFRDQWEARVRQQAELWGGQPQWRFVPLHFMGDYQYDNNTAALCREGTLDWFLSQSHWEWTTSAFNLPVILREHLGQTTYKPRLDFLGVQDA